MGRAAKFDREAAVEICMNEIWRNGFETCSVKALSEKLGITRSSFYNAFGSREDLFLEVLALYFTQTPDRVFGSVDAKTPVRRLLTDFFKDVCQTRATDPDAKGCLAVNCISELVGVDETLGPVLANTIHASIDRLEAVLKTAAANGEIENDGHLREKALALQNLIVGLSVLSRVVHSEKALLSITRQTLTGLDLYAE
ncbi:hypothetical protein MNBD_GAMMA13-1803 [hydrothermal vent metagenome]|uniref:HTH tetR-type domain-containing protein n=1 Tax=hydrothermal vent metagenome TaxID=652676 RepID=A0A3B0YSQ7_9ZZZZ